MFSVVDPDLELSGGAGLGEGHRGGFVLLALPAFFPSVISSLFTKNKWSQHWFSVKCSVLIGFVFSPFRFCAFYIRHSIQCVLYMV